MACPPRVPARDWVLLQRRSRFCHFQTQMVRYICKKHKENFSLPVTLTKDARRTDWPTNPQFLGIQQAR